eukprot:TRINITY_DN3650_c0_g1_i9.p1 TRINITY_DN3650_c0_g1~~TRINITY_DN3650_c0_g1_i9.p1  ORF type:complete len:144 (+),score=29.23 TRINITY_DN3650_c0_g1_i9:147-578(+)
MGGVPMGGIPMFGSPMPPRNSDKTAPPATPSSATTPSPTDDDAPPAQESIPELPKGDSDGNIVHLTKARPKVGGRGKGGRKAPTKKKVDFATLTETTKVDVKVTLTKDADVKASAAPKLDSIHEIGRAVQQECRDRSRMPSSA